MCIMSLHTSQSDCWMPIRNACHACSLWCYVLTHNHSPGVVMNLSVALHWFRRLNRRKDQETCLAFGGIHGRGIIVVSTIGTGSKILLKLMIASECLNNNENERCKPTTRRVGFREVWNCVVGFLNFYFPLAISDALLEHANSSALAMTRTTKALRRWWKANLWTVTEQLNATIFHLDKMAG